MLKEAFKRSMKENRERKRIEDTKATREMGNRGGKQRVKIERKRQESEGERGEPDEGRNLLVVTRSCVQDCRKKTEGREGSSEGDTEMETGRDGKEAVKRR